MTDEETYEVGKEPPERSWSDDVSYHLIRLNMYDTNDVHIGSHFIGLMVDSSEETGEQSYVSSSVTRETEPEVDYS